MGRKPYAAKSKERAPMKSEGSEELPPQITSPSSERAELRSEKTNQSLEKVEPQPKMQANCGNVSSKRKGKHAVSVNVRRSVRLQGTIVHTHNQDIERLIEEVALSESDKEDEPPSYEEMEQPEPTTEEKNLEDKVDYIIQLIEGQQSKFSPHESRCTCHAKYKSLYFDSQKKIETLTNENHRLALKLEDALDKIEANGKYARSYSELVEKWKDMFLVANLTKTAENARHEQEAGCEAKPSSSKRKKLDK
ncbi:hypothetical protein Pint_03336 [Pistacia integerrima]|uniref:Uncharacterized protein n=1 Tax=Pistacia integerrima TaxID=434235 RepID=A0ACC0ZMC3_9ROSI|nr:hypothetical protein Pint_03336 [Pistacia integerrima]